MKNTFICYESTTGQGFATHLKIALERSNEIKYNVFLADVSLVGGDKWKNKIDKALLECDFFLIIITALTMDSFEVKREFDIAIKLNKKIIPLRFSGIKIKDTYEISDIQQISFADKYELANNTLLELSNILEQQSNDLLTESNEYFRRGNFYYNFKKYDDALLMYNKALQINPNFPEAWGNISKIYGILNKNEKALVYIEKALEISPKFSEAWIGRGSIFINLENFPDALVSFENALTINPDSVDALCFKGALLGKLNRYNEALVPLNKALKLEPKDYHTLALRGYTYFKLIQFNDAETDYNTAISIKPDYAEAWYNMACLYSKKNDKEKTIKYLTKAINFSAEYKNSFIEDEDFNNIVTLKEIEKK